MQKQKTSKTAVSSLFQPVVGTCLPYIWRFIGHIFLSYPVISFPEYFFSVQRKRTSISAVSSLRQPVVGTRLPDFLRLKGGETRALLPKLINKHNSNTFLKLVPKVMSLILLLSPTNSCPTAFCASARCFLFFETCRLVMFEFFVKAAASPSRFTEDADAD